MIHVQRLAHLRSRVAKGMLAKCQRDRAHLLAAGAVLVHVSPRPQRMHGRGAEEAELRAEFLRLLGLGDQGNPQLRLRRARTRPRIPPVSTDNHFAQPRLDRHARQPHRHTLARPAVVQCRAEGDIQAQRPPDPLVMAIYIIRPARDQSVNLALLDPRILDRIGDRFDQQPDRAAPRHRAEAALPHADDRVFVPQIPGHQTTPSCRSLRRAASS